MINLKLPNDRSGIFVSVLAHIILFLFLFFVGCGGKEKVEPLDGGVEVSIGQPNMGGPSSTAAEEMETAAEVSPQTPDVVEEARVTNDDGVAEVKATEKKTEQKKTEQKTETKTEQKTEKKTETKTEKKKETRKIDPKTQFGNKEGDKNSKGQGDGEDPGNKGDPNGTKKGDPDGSGQGEGGKGFSGDGFEGKIDGFKAVATYKPENNQQKFGTVVVQVCVDRNGSIISVKAGQRGSSTTDAYLYRLSEQAAKKFKFERTGTASARNCGNITFRYKKG